MKGCGGGVLFLRGRGAPDSVSFGASQTYGSKTILAHKLADVFKYVVDLVVLEDHGITIDLVAFGKAVQVELNHTRLVGGLFVHLLLVTNAFSDAGDDRHTSNNPAIEDSETKPRHIVVSGDSRESV